MIFLLTGIGALSMKDINLKQTAITAGIAIAAMALVYRVPAVKKIVLG